MVPLSAGARVVDELEASQAAPQAADFEGADASRPCDVPCIPPGFRDRVRQLSPFTITDIPPQCIHRLCEITAVNIEGGINGASEFATLEEACAKLLLGQIPKGMHVTQEVRHRIDMWDKRDFEGLLRRAEEQHHRRAAERSQRRDADGKASARYRARRSAQAGAYRRACSGSLPRLQPSVPKMNGSMLANCFRDLAVQ